MTRNYALFSEDLSDDTYDRYQDLEPVKEVYIHKPQVYTVQLVKDKGVWKQQIVSVRAK